MKGAHSARRGWMGVGMMACALAVTAQSMPEPGEMEEALTHAVIQQPSLTPEPLPPAAEAAESPSTEEAAQLPPAADAPELPAAGEAALPSPAAEAPQQLAVDEPALSPQSANAPDEMPAAIASPAQSDSAAVPAPSTDAAIAPAEVLGAGDVQPAGQMHLRTVSYLRLGHEQLRVVRREDAQALVARVAFSAVSGAASDGVVVPLRPFSKLDLAGSPIDGMDDLALASHPALNDLRDALGAKATQVDRDRVTERLEQGRREGWAREQLAQVAQIRPESDWLVYAGRWHLVYENLSGDDELYRLHLGAAIGHEGLLRPPFECAFQSAPIAWSDWMADDWQRLREEKARAVARCSEVLGATPALTGEVPSGAPTPVEAP